MIYVRTNQPPVYRRGIQNVGVQGVGGWSDFLGPLIGAGLQIGGGIATSLIASKLAPKQQVTTLPQPANQLPGIQPTQWINGVSNGVVLAGGAALLGVLVIVMARK